jgi:alanyl-tRNA synthetase
MPSGAEIRQGFLDFFARHNHAILASSSLVPRQDPTLIFTNAGMVQFKNVFTGAQSAPHPRAATSQKCVRAGGKHNDLDNVGFTARHHTFFEMLGNFSFGDYFKETAIELAWAMLTKEFGIDPERLWATVYHDDDEAFDLWRKISGLPEARIVRIATDDNFWSMGERGPCGPCSEIFYDHGPVLKGGPPGSPDADGDRYVEIWNLVFMQFDQIDAGRRVPLPKPSIDTGMGLERLAAVLQGCHDNYDTDLLRTLIEASAELSRTAPDGSFATSHRVIADHLRASCFLIADGVLPANEGRGYVLRRIMRRAMRHAHQMGCSEPLMWRLAASLVGLMGRGFPELNRAERLIVETLRLEETRFKQTLERGLKLLDEEAAKLTAGQKLPGETAFKLYDTYGFPLDLTEDALRGRGMGVERAGFDAAMARQREDARRAWSGSGDTAASAIWFDVRERLGPTEFLGYQTEVAEGRVDAIVVDGREVDAVGAGTDAAIVVNQTPFYAEAGGQAGDTGTLFSADGAQVTVGNTQKQVADLHVHVGRVEKGSIKRGMTVELRVDGARRARIRANHSATHLLHAGLRRRLGPHVTQKGSLVAADRLRFDFSHMQPLTPDDIIAIEAEINAQILANTEATTRLMTPIAAMATGALALFGEKYGNEVRVVSMGAPSGGGDASGAAYSTEFCGGTHVRRTGDIGLFKIMSESAVASGVRRIEAMTGEAARAYLSEAEAALRAAAAVLKIPPADLPARLATLVEERRKLERDLAQARLRASAGGDARGDNGDIGVRDVGGIKFQARLIEGVAAKDLRGLADREKQHLGSGVVALAATTEGKLALVVGVTNDLTARISAVDLARAGALAAGGKGGGGRPEFAQAGGPDGARAAAALDAVASALATAASA